MRQPTINLEHIDRAMPKTNNWKAARNDHIHNFWYKKVEIKRQLRDQLAKIMKNKDKTPFIRTKGKTF